MNKRMFWDNEARKKATGKGKNSPFGMKCWPGYKAEGTKKSPSGKKTAGGNIKMVNNCVEK
jgi:hypothetical protein